MSDELVEIRFLARTIYYALNALPSDADASQIRNLADKTENLTAALSVLCDRDFKPVQRSEPIWTKKHANALMQEVLEKYDLTEAELLGKARFVEYVRPRHELMWRLFHELKWSYSRIGRMMNRDHSNIFFGVNAHQKTMKETP